MSNNNPNNIRLSACRVRWGGRDLGMTKGGVEVSMKTDTHQVQVDQFGNTPLNEIVLGRTLTVKCPFAETDLDNLYAMLKQSGSVLNDAGTTATGTLTYATQPAANDTFTVNGHKFTWVATTPGVDQILIGAAVGASVINAVAALQACSDPLVEAGVYTAGATVINVSYFRSGTVGNTFTLAKTGTTGTVSGATLTGGVDGTRSLAINAGVGTSLLAGALPLVLHPLDKADNDTSEDFIVPLANGAGNLSFAYKLDQERIYTLEFTGYPNTSTGVLAKYGA